VVKKELAAARREAGGGGNGDRGPGRGKDGKGD
jgi:hypothetical protein